MNKTSDEPYIISEKSPQKIETDLWYINTETSLPDEVPLSDLSAFKTESLSQKTILVVDDNDPLRRIFRAALENEGYKVLTAKGGAEALQIIHKNPNGVSLAIIDQCMPHMTGQELYERLRQAAPEIKIILTSGYYTDGPPPLQNDSQVTFLHKPFHVAHLFSLIKDALDSKP